jgi:hypothetical protein
MKMRLSIILLIIGVLAVAYSGYFKFITTLSSPTNMELFMPRDSEKDSVDRFNYTKKKLTLILLKDEKVFGYYGDLINSGKIVSSDKTSELINDGWKMFSKDSLVVIIKPTEKATYKQTVDMLDKMSKNHIEKYSMGDLDKKEKEFLKIDE